MNRRRFLLFAGAATLIPATAARAAQIPLSRLSGYMNALVTAKAGFTQINPDGTISTGTLYLQRPGRARFEYDPPEDALVMAGGGQVAVFDGKSNLGRPEQYPLARTPLSIILESNVDLARRNMVVGHTFDGTATTVIAQDPRHPEYGRIELKFTDNPVALRQWVVVDGSGARTTIILNGMETGESLSASLFNITLEEQRRLR